MTDKQDDMSEVVSLQDDNAIISEHNPTEDIAQLNEPGRDQPLVQEITRPMPTDSATADQNGLPSQPHKDEPAAGHDGEDDEPGTPIPEATAPLVATLPTDSNPPPLSKSQQKKLRRKADWESKRDERRAIRKEKQTAKRERRRAARDAQGGDDVGGGGRQPHRPVHAPRAAQLPVTILIDCAFDELMRDHERTSLASQLTRCYSDNRTAPFRAHLAVCSFGGELRRRFDTVLDHYKGWKGVRFVESDFVAAAAESKEWMREPRVGGRLVGPFAPETGQQAEGGADDDGSEQDDAALREQLEAEAEVVYLSSEADETLTALKPYSTYIVGGLVDKNREKGICHRRACERGVRTARLPISEFMELQSRKVLATNHVNEIMLRWLELGDWGEAFMRVIPKRKGGKLKGGDGQDVTGQSVGNANGSADNGDEEIIDALDGAEQSADTDTGMVEREDEDKADDKDDGSTGSRSEDMTIDEATATKDEKGEERT